jgi:hypothetical protein
MTIISFASASRRPEQDAQAARHKAMGVDTVQYGEGDIDQNQAKFN